MQIDIRAKGFELSPALREHAERRLGFALSWAVYDVRKVAVRLYDINGPRGGEDKCCRIQIALPGTSDVVIEDTETDLYMAINRAVDRAERSLARRLERQREHRHVRQPVVEITDDPSAEEFQQRVDAGVFH